MATQGLGDRALGLLEALGTVATSTLAEIPRGYGNLAGLLATGDPDRAIDYGNRVADNLIYEPTERSAPYLSALGSGLEAAYEYPAPLTGISAKDMYEGTQSFITSQDPTAAGVLGAGFEGILATGLPTIRNARKASLFGNTNIPTELLPQIDRAVSANPQVEGILPYLTENEAARVTPITADALVATYNAVNPQELVGAAVEGAPKLGWYEQTSKAINTIMGNDTPRFSALLAALSPQTSVEMNLINTVNTWANWEKAGRPTDPNKIIEIMGQSVLGDKGIDSVLPAWRANAVRALTSPADELTGNILLSGPKVNDFSQAVQGDLSRFVNDAWQANLTGIPQQLFSGSGTQLPGYGPGYLGASAAGRKAAELMSIDLNQDIMPSEIQETGWSFAKALYEQMADMRASGQNVTAEQILRDGMLDTSRISDVPDFATLFTQDLYGAPLREIGYGSLIDKAAGASAGIGTRDITGAARPEGALNVARRLDALFDHRQFVSATTPLRPRFSDSEAATSSRKVSVPYRITSRRSVPLSFGASGRPQTPSQEIQRAVGVDLPQLYQLNKTSADRAAFVNAMREAQASRGAVGRSVDVYDPADYKNYKLFTTEDGASGFAISPDGELSSVVSNKNGGARGFSDAALAAAVSNGARWLNAFDTVLPQKYARFGFKPVARIKFDEQFARDSWGDAAVDGFMKATADFQGGKPDLVFMVYDPTFKNTVANNVGGKLVGSWDDAMSIVEREKSKLAKK